MRYEVEREPGSREPAAMNPNDQPFDPSFIAERYLGIKERVWRAAQKHGRDAASVKLVAVSKTFDAAHIKPVLEEGHRVFGENRVQEAIRKWPALRNRFEGIELHLIGPLQSNKVREAVEHFDCIQTLDRPKLASALASEIQKQGKHPKLLVQVNTGEEEQKAGVAPSKTEEFVAQCAKEFGLTVSGLMCIPPAEDDPSSHFEMLRSLRSRLGLLDLSMGMSSDFEIAIDHGATVIRVGSAIFGSR